MNDDKNRDWVVGAALQFAAECDVSSIQAERIIRSHIPPQPPIAENVRELAETIMEHHVTSYSTIERRYDVQLGQISQYIQSFLTAHDQKRDVELKDTKRLLMEKNETANVFMNQVKKLQKLDAELQNKVSRLSRALDIATDVGVYPQSVVGGDQPYKERTDYMNGWNAHATQALKEVTAALKDGDWQDEQADRNGKVVKVLEQIKGRVMLLQCNNGHPMPRNLDEIFNAITQLLKELKGQA